MFNSKQKPLIVTQKEATSVEKATTTSGPGNAFLGAALKVSAETLSENGALKYSSTGNEFVDQFGKLGGYKAPRTFSDISKDASTLWGISPVVSIMFILYLRIVTRVVSFFDGTKTTTVQRGAGLRHEAIMRMVWLQVNHPDSFWKNIGLFISAGCWKDIIQMLTFDLVYNSWKGRVLDWDGLGKLLLAGLENPNSSELIKKYLPQIKSNSQCTTIEAQSRNSIAKWLCSLIFDGKGTEEDHKFYKEYRKLKSSGSAHRWQQLISKGKFLDIDFNTVHGRALAQLVSGKFITNNGLEDKYVEWIKSKPVAKFTGYAHELFKEMPSQLFQQLTVNAQFLGLVETAKKDAVTNTGMIVVRDTSGSMGQEATGTGMKCGDVAKALALFFSYMLPEGAFANSWIEFNSNAKMHTWKGTTPMEKFTNDHSNYIGSTNFQSVIDLFCKLKKDGIDESEFPSGIICISDGEFNPTMLGQTNVKVAQDKLRRYGFSEEYLEEFKIVLWNLARRRRSYWSDDSAGDKFETHGDEKNVFYFSGYDASVMAFLTGVQAPVTEDTPDAGKTPSTAAELFEAAMNQEILNMVQV